MSVRSKRLGLPKKPIGIPSALRITRTATAGLAVAICSLSAPTISAQFQLPEINPVPQPEGAPQMPPPAVVLLEPPQPAPASAGDGFRPLDVDAAVDLTDQAASAPTEQFGNPGELNESVGLIQLSPLENSLHPPVVTALAIDADAAYALAAGDDHVLRLVRLRDGHVEALMHGHTGWVRKIAVLDKSDGMITALSCGDDGRLLRWKIERSRAGDISVKSDLWLECGHTLADFAIAADAGRVVCGGFSHQIDVIDSTDGQPIATLHCDCNDQRALLITPDGRRVLCGGRDGRLHAFDLSAADAAEQADRDQASLSPSAEAPIHRGRIRDISFSQDGLRVFSVGDDHRICETDLRSLERLSSIELKSGKLMTVQILDDQRILAAGADNTIYVIDRVSGQVRLRLFGHDGTVAAMQINQQLLLTTGFDTTIRGWRLPTDLPPGGRVLVHPVRSQFADSGLQSDVY